MKNILLVSVLLFCSIFAIGQSKNNKFGITCGFSIQHYNGNLGNSFFKFDRTIFGGFTSNFGVYLNKSFDFNIGGSIGHFGYCQTEADSKRKVSLEQRCPGCTDRLGMGDLKSSMLSGNIAIKYKLANGLILNEDSKFAPYLYVGLGINRLSDTMKKNCVNVGTHFTINSGVGIKYNITESLNIGYNLGLGCFMTKKVYYTNAIADDTELMDPDDIRMEKRKDFYLQNALTLGVNF